MQKKNICVTVKGEENTDKSGLSCINLKINNHNKSHNQITRRRSFSCIGLSKGSHKTYCLLCLVLFITFTYFSLLLHSPFVKKIISLYS